MKCTWNSIDLQLRLPGTGESGRRYTGILAGRSEYLEAEIMADTIQNMSGSNQTSIGSPDKQVMSPVGSSLHPVDELVEALQSSWKHEGVNGPEPAPYRRVLDNVAEPVAVIDDTHAFCYLNHAFESVAEAPEELIGTPSASFFPDPSQSLRFQKLVKTVLSSSEPMAREGLWNLDGKAVKARLHLRSLRLSDRTSVLFLIEDLSEEASSSSPGEDPARPVQLATTAIADFVLRAPVPLGGPVEKCFSALLNAQLVSFNRSWNHMPGTGHRAVERGMTAGSVFPFRRFKKLITTHWIEKGFEPFSFETKHEEGDQETLHIESTLVGKIAEGFLEGFWVMRRDVSDLKVAESALGQAYDRLKIHVTEQASDLRTLSEKLLDALTQQKLAEDAIQEQNEYVGHIIDSVTDPLFAVTLEDYSVPIANSAAVSLACQDQLTCWGIIHGRKEPCGPDEPECALELVKQTLSPARTEVARLIGEDDIAHLEVLAYPIFDQDRLLKQVALSVRDITAQKVAEEDLREGKRKLEKTLQGTVAALASITERKDPTTSGHQQRVAQLAAAVAGNMELDEETVTGIQIAASLHDIGNISVPAELLLRPGRLNEYEVGIVQQHPQQAYEILKEIEFPWPVAEIVLQHHERLDGSGYPNGLGAHAIRKEAAILAVADVVEAMSSHRAHRPAHTRDEIEQELLVNRGILYDEQVVDACIHLLRNGFEFLQTA